MQLTCFTMQKRDANCLRRILFVIECMNARFPSHTNIDADSITFLITVVIGALRVFWGTCCQCGQVGPCRSVDIGSAAASSRVASSASKGKGLPDGQKSRPTEPAGITALLLLLPNDGATIVLVFVPCLIAFVPWSRHWQGGVGRAVPGGPKTTNARQKPTWAA